MNYKQNNLTTPLFIVVVMIVASLSPLALASSDIDAETSEFSYGSLDDFDPSIEGKNICSQMKRNLHFRPLGI